MCKEKILDKIQKCFALAGNNPNENEVDNAMRAAKRLMAENNLSMADVEDHESAKSSEERNFDFKRVDLPERGYYGTWEKGLLSVCDVLFEVRHVFMRRRVYRNGRNLQRNRLVFMGVEGEAKLAAEVFILLKKSVEKMARKRFGASWSSPHRSYAEGYGMVLLHRAMQMNQEVYSGSRALVIVKDKGRQLDELVEQGAKTEKCRAPKEGDGMAKMLGQADGMKANLNFRGALQ